MIKKTLFIPAVLLSVVVFSVTLASKVSAQLVVQSYQTTQTLQDGLIVSLKVGNSTEVVPTTKNAEKGMFGVVTTPGASAISLSGTTSQQVFVANSGNYSVLVSSENGGISVGDYITVSSLDGIGMKASSTDGYIIGKAISVFNPTTQSIGSTSLVSSTGAKSTVQLGRITVALGVSHNPLQTPSHSNLPAFLITAGDTIANKAVSSSRLLLSFMLLLICCAMTASLLYSGVHEVG